METHLQVTRLTSKSLTTQSKVFRKGETELLAEGRVTTVCIDRETFRARPIPSPLRQLLKPRALEELEQPEQPQE